MPRVLRRAASRLGRRGAFLSCYGSIWVLYGAGQLGMPQPDQRGLQPLLALVPLGVWAWCWITAGTIALATAWADTGEDWPGFVALSAIVLPWTVSYLGAWAIGEYSRGWIAAAVWAVAGTSVLVVAGWPEPPRRKEIGARP